MAETLKQHAKLVARRHELLQELEALHAELDHINLQLSKRAAKPPIAKPGTARHAILSVMREGFDKLFDITAAASVELKRDLSTTLVANQLIRLHNLGLVVHVGRSWRLIDPNQVVVDETSTNALEGSGR